MLTPYEYTLVALSAYEKAMEPICKKYSVKHKELDILMFLNDNPSMATASDVVKKLNFSKSLVSISLRALEERGFILGECKGTDRRSIYLHICDSARALLSEAVETRRQFSLAMAEGLTEEEKKQLLLYLGKVRKNLVSLSKK
jgi:DNA-binding MarR family transcriptional regulator